ncbi:hypothetical protein PSH79_15050 [Pseudomonas sp. FP2196]|uniref:Imm32 family immunity protein n=1 Tax=Pseudomonas sp. FP2196 TaxID=2954086 RepID=UPI002735B620|nr:hypothetical protein [Pseudomonas sp. FP2196]WLH33257.1 hypothetical protein PSH79_15050 [Pseudomonas sp. FP2196]
MRKLAKFTVHGTAVNSDQEIKLDEISILADPETLREIGRFLIKASKEMSKSGLEHIHLQDVIDDFDYENNVDFIALNGNVVKAV